LRRIKDGFDKTLEESELDKDKINQLDENTINSIKSAYDDISRIKGEDIEQDNRDKISNTMEVIRGIRMLLNKEAFIKNVSVHHLNADSIVGESIKYNYYNHFASKIALQSKSRKYTVQYGKTYAAIDQMNPDPNEYIIVNFGINMNYLRDFLGIKIEEPTGNENYRYKSIPIYCFDFSYLQVYLKTYLISRSNMPMIKHKDWSEIKGLSNETKERWRKMDLINPDLKIYRKINDLNKENEVKNGYLTQGKSEDQLKNMIEIDVDFLGYCWFKKDTQLIEIKESELFREGGSVDDLDSIKPLK
jgi:hypothetical protein